MSSTYKDPYSGYYYSDQYEYEDEETGKTINVVGNEEYFEICKKLYANVLDASGMNLMDPVGSYITHFNKFQRRHVDPPYAGKTYVFMTRPDLNFWELETGVRNIQAVPIFNYFSKTKVGRAVIPFLMFPNNMPTEFDGERTSRSFIGNDSIDKDYLIYTPFIPLVTNFCKSTGGGKDISLDTYETEGDFSGNKLQYAKGADESFSIGEVTLDFDDAPYSLILHLINMWVHYIHFLTKGIVVSCGKYVRYRILDYTCSIYVFMTEKDGRTLARWAKYTGCFPKNVPLGAIQHNIESNPEQLRDISISYAYNRYEAMNPSTLMDFNFLMDKFLTDTDESNINLMKNIGVAPKKMLDSYTLKSSEYISSNPEWCGPKYEDENKDLLYKDTNYYDNKFWGTIPYIMNHQLVWIDPTTFFK